MPSRNEKSNSKEPLSKRVHSVCFNFWKEPKNMFHNEGKDYLVLEDGETETLIHKDGSKEIITKAMKLSFNSLKLAAETAHKQILEEKWTQQTAKSYLKRFCFNIEAQTSITQCVANCLQKKKAMMGNNTELIKSIREKELEEPDMYKKWNTTAYYYSGLECIGLRS